MLLGQVALPIQRFFKGILARGAFWVVIARGGRNKLYIVCKCVKHTWHAMHACLIRGVWGHALPPAPPPRKFLKFTYCEIEIGGNFNLRFIKMNVPSYVLNNNVYDVLAFIVKYLHCSSATILRCSCKNSAAMKCTGLIIPDSTASVE